MRFKGRAKGRLCTTPNEQGLFKIQQNKFHRCVSAASSRFIAPPERSYEVDEDLWAVLDICNNEELEEIHGILYGNIFSGSDTRAFCRNGWDYLYRNVSTVYYRRQCIEPTGEVLGGR